MKTDDAKTSNSVPFHWPERTTITSPHPSQFANSTSPDTRDFRNALSRQTIAALLLLFSCSIAANQTELSEVYIADIEIISPSGDIENGPSTEAIHAHLHKTYRGFGRTMSLEDIRRIAGTISEYYKSEGYPFTRAYLAPQEIVNGIVTINVLYGALTGVAISGNRRYHETQLTAPFAELIGKPIEVDRLADAINTVNAFPGLKVTGHFSKAEADGGTLLNIEIKEEKHASVRFGYDNYGQDATGKDRVSAAASVHNPLGIADQLDIRVSKSIGDGDSGLGSVAYKAPLFDDKFTAQLQLYRSEYFIGDDVLLNTSVPVTGSLELDGSLDGIGLSTNYQFRNANDTKLGMTTSFDYRWLDNDFELDGRSILANGVDDQYEYWRLSFGGNALFRNVLPNVSVLGSAEFFHGNTTDTGTDDNAFTGVSLSGLGVLALGGGHSERWYAGTLELKLNGQYSGDALPASERGAVVGSNGVSAYDPGLFYGDSFVLAGVQFAPRKLRLEYQDFALAPYVFYEHAYGSKNSISTPTLNIDSSWVEFSGGGIGAHLSFGKHLDARVQWAFPAVKDGAVRDDLRRNAQFLAEVSIKFDL